MPSFQTSKEIDGRASSLAGNAFVHPAVLPFQQIAAAPAVPFATGYGQPQGQPLPGGYTSFAPPQGYMPQNVGGPQFNPSAAPLPPRPVAGFDRGGAQAPRKKGLNLAQMKKGKQG